MEGSSKNKDWQALGQLFHRTVRRIVSRICIQLFNDYSIKGLN